MIDPAKLRYRTRGCPDVIGSRTHSALAIDRFLHSTHFRSHNPTIRPKRPHRASDRQTLLPADQLCTSVKVLQNPVLEVQQLSLTPGHIRLSAEELGFELFSLPHCFSKFPTVLHRLIAYLRANTDGIPPPVSFENTTCASAAAGVRSPRFSWRRTSARRICWNGSRHIASNVVRSTSGLASFHPVPGAEQSCPRRETEAPSGDERPRDGHARDGRDSISMTLIWINRASFI
ncbi:hypothetical protein ABIB85_008347 [Bradyrhizobium sp. JR1.5]